MSRKGKTSGLAGLVAETEAGTGEAHNPDGVKYVRYVKTNAAPTRRQRSIYVQDATWRAMEALAYEQKLANNRRAPELWEKAVELAVDFYKSQDS